MPDNPTLVERLARKSADEQYPFAYDKYPNAYKDQARWWLNAIADELEAESERKLSAWCKSPLVHAIYWLRGAGSDG